MNNRKKDKNKRARLSLQNRDLVRNQLNLVIDNMGMKAREKEVTEEEDPLKFFSQQQRKKEKEEEAKKYLHPIAEEEDPLKFFEKKDDDETEQDPLKFLKKNENPDDPKVLGNLAKHDEEKLAEALKKNDIPEEIVIKKENKERSNSEDKEKKLQKRLNTALRFTQRVNMVKRINDKLLGRVKNAKNAKEVVDTLKKDEPAIGGDTLLSSEEQIDPASNSQTTKQRKDVDLSKFMEKK